MATQLGVRPSRIERRNEDELENLNEINRISSKTNRDNNPINQINKAGDIAKNVFKKPITLNFICMVLISVTLDLLSLIPGFNILISILYNILFIPWFYFSGIKFTIKKISSMGVTSIIEYIPIVSILPAMTLNTIYSYYSN
jgi:hypothetical protein